ncbi:head-tail adaptor protein [Lacticaseibacillus saniviri]
MVNRPEYVYKRPPVSTGDLRIPVQFLEQTPNEDGEPGDLPTKIVYKAWAQVYAPSQKDTQLLNAADLKEGVTIKVRDTRGEFLPQADKHQVHIDDYRYQNKNWNVVNVRLDFENDAFLVIVLGYPKEADIHAG